MPNHLQSRSDDMHSGKAKTSGIRVSTIIIIGGLVTIVAAILMLT